MKPISDTHAKVQATPEEREQARLIAGFAYFENGKAKFPEAYHELIYSIAVTAFQKPEAFCNFLLNAREDESVDPGQWLKLGEALGELGLKLANDWRERAGGTP